MWVAGLLPGDLLGKKPCHCVLKDALLLVGGQLACH